ncbi:MAG TPA: 3-hydroxyacyl-CoA dehydrogenase NAD-binding domain-containing protein [Thermoanaerobaculia bacterium]|nr:3-hydroxyacyl-CoA dehydrogenase NAD-binding domain-containing protein [Thermoanaerobaculia bacterium]
MASIFRLAVGSDRLATLTFDLPDKKVNVFTRAALAELEQVLGEIAGRQDIGCLILLSGKRGAFIAGADVEEISRVSDPVEAEAGSRLGHRLFAAWEALSFPTVAAIRGTCLGGGTEWALASTYRVASDGAATRIGLPEVRLGIVPGWGGCTRLPRLIGIPEALDLILTGRNVAGRKALKLGLVDALLPDARFLDQVRDFARERIGKTKREGKGGFDFKELLLERNPLGRKVLFDQARKKTLEESRGHYPAPLRAIEVVRIGIEDGMRAGFDAEARTVAELATSRISKNLVHVFRLTEEAKREEGLPGGAARPVKRVAVLGAGVMGGGIAQLVSAEADLPVRMKDVRGEALASGMAHAAGLFDRQVQRHRLEPPAARRKMALLQPTLDYSGFADCDLVVEAILEKLEVKQAVFAELAGKVPETAVLASNTSSLSIEKIGARTPHPERVVGMHFFNPVHKMPLVEVIAPAGAAAWAVNTVFDFTRKLGKTPVLVKDAPGFLVNRLLMFYSSEALWLLDEGYRIEDLDRAMADWGMPVGPMALTDEVGIDVATKVAHILHEAFGDRLALPAWLDRVPDSGRLGTKNGKGFYRYEGRERKDPDPAVYGLLGLQPRVDDPDPGRIADRMVLPMVNEAARCLEEGVVRTAGELDLAMIFGTGFPPFRGGLCRWADTEGLGQIVVTLERLEVAVSDRFRPSDALRRTVEAGGFYARFGARVEEPAAVGA